MKNNILFYLFFVFELLSFKVIIYLRNNYITNIYFMLYK